MGALSRKTLEGKARGVTAGAAFIAKHGEEEFQRFLDEFFYDDIADGDKVAEERPPRKRPLPAVPDLPERDAKRWKVDPDTLSPYEKERGKLRCKVCFKNVDAAYILPAAERWGWTEIVYGFPSAEPRREEEKVVCLACWEKKDRESHCADCGKQVLCTHSGGDTYRCRTCIHHRFPATVVNLRGKRGQYEGPLRNPESQLLYVGRKCKQGGWNLAASRWANPYKGEDAVDRYEQHVRQSPALMAAISELAGKTLCCWCHPKPCHADVLVKLVAEWQAVAGTQITK